MKKQIVIPAAMVTLFCSIWLGSWTDAQFRISDRVANRYATPLPRQDPAATALAAELTRQSDAVLDDLKRMKTESEETIAKMNAETKKLNADQAREKRVRAAMAE